MKIQSALKALAGTALLALGAGAHAAPLTVNGFAGEYAPDRWTATVTGDGFVDTLDAPGSVSLVCYDACSIDFTIESTLENATVGFDWDASLFDAFWVYSTFGFLLNDVVTEIVTLGPNDWSFVAAAGSSVFNVGLGDVFGFRLSCLECWDYFGDVSDAIISGFTIAGTVPVPEPGTLALLSLGLLGAGAMRRSRRAS